jgi:hypothetical protein
MGVLYQSKVPRKLSAFVVMTTAISFLISIVIVYLITGDVTTALTVSGIACLASFLYCVYVVRFVIAPRVEGLKITDKKIYLPKRSAQQVGRDHYLLTDIETKYFSGNYLALEFKDGESTAILTFERERVEKALANAMGKSEKK